ncbi:MAG: DUF4126 domain-containing protein [Deltaproteobacteria bacterium]|nr:DUF4126 domain-containing protein [Deltaproteobacteria bacterium]
MDPLLSICLGIGLAAACGFRVFVPFLALSVAASSGHVALSPGFEWIGTEAALIAFLVAAFVEILAYEIPWLDHLLDVIAAPAAVIAGVLLTASAAAGVDPFLRWSLALIAGGGVAATVQGATSLARATSTFGTAGLANPLLALVESGTAVAVAMAALFVPVLTALAVGIALLVVARWLVRRSRRRPPVSNASPGPS